MPAALGALIRRRHARFRRELAAAVADQSIAHVHQARVQARALRSVLGTLRPVVDTTLLERSRRELRALARDLEEVREADVRRDWLLELAGAAGTLESDLHRHLIEALEQARATARRRLRERAASTAWRQRLDRLQRSLAAGQLISARKLAPRQLAALLERRWRRLSKQGRHAPQAGAEALHRLRLAVKHARYASEALLPLLGIEPRPYVKPLKALQSCLGDHHDAVLAGEWLARLGEPPGASLAAALGRDLGRRIAQRERQLAGLLHKLKRPPL